MSETVEELATLPERPPAGKPLWDYPLEAIGRALLDEMTLAESLWDSACTLVKQGTAANYPDFDAISAAIRTRDETELTLLELGRIKTRLNKEDEERAAEALVTPAAQQ